MLNYVFFKAAEGARIAGAGRIIGIDLIPERFEKGTKCIDFEKD